MDIPSSDNYQTKSAVLFIIFNRADTTSQVFAAIRNAQPKRLYITADGPRNSKIGEAERCEQARAIVAHVDWECEVKTLFRDQNLGPKEAVSSAIDWFFSHETEGIILEHDCLPAKSFFMFCDTLLEKYRYDTRIWLISGSNLTGDKKWGTASYYYSNLTNGWGWATWRRSWQQYDKELTGYNENEVREQLEKIFDNSLIVDRWQQIFIDTKAGKIDTWDYQATFAHFFNHCVNIVSNNNLVSNIGFGEGAENTLNADSVFANIPLQEINEIKHPKYMLPEKEADNMILWEEFFIADKLVQLRKNKLPHRRLKKWIKRVFR